MDKLEYDSLYKFLVSLGIILIVLPVIAFVYLFNVEPILISQMDYDALSEFSLQMIANRNELVSFFIGIFPYFGGISICLGIGFLLYGLYKWGRNQSNLDKKLDAEATMQTLSLLGMTSKEVEDKVENEVKEATADSVEDIDPMPVSTQKSLMNQYRYAEELCLKYFSEKFGRKYSFKQNIRIGKFIYDLIGVSQKDDVDLLIEVKYWRNPEAVRFGLQDACKRMDDACENYQTVAHRNSTGIVFIVAPDERFADIKNAVDHNVMNALSGNKYRIVVKCVSEEVI